MKPLKAVLYTIVSWTPSKLNFSTVSRIKKTIRISYNETKIIISLTSKDYEKQEHFHHHFITIH